MTIGVHIHSVRPPLRASSTYNVGELTSTLATGELAGPGIVVAPAGLAVVDNDDQAFETAERLRVAARKSGLALVFGIDVGPPQPGSSRLFACLGGAPVLWPITGHRGFPPDAGRRVLSIGGARILPLLATEALDPLAARRVLALGALDAIAILSHGGATARWAPALSRLESFAPILVAAHRGGAGRGYATATLDVRFHSFDKEAELARAA